MNEPRRPSRRGRGPRRPNPNVGGDLAEPNPYRDADSGDGGSGGTPGTARAEADLGESYTPPERLERPDTGDRDGAAIHDTESPDDRSGQPPQSRDDQPPRLQQSRDANVGGDAGGAGSAGGGTGRQQSGRGRHQHPRGRGQQGGGGGNAGGNHASNGNRDGNVQGDRDGNRDGGRRGRRNRGRGPRRGGEQVDRGPVLPVVADGETTGWFDLGRDGGYLRRAAGSYLAEPGDAFVPLPIVRQIGLRRGDLVDATVGRDPRGRTVVAEIKSVNGDDAANAARRPEFATLTASYPERKLWLETGRAAKGGNELIRRAIDLIAPIGFGQRALIVAPARAGKTTLLHAITEGVALNHPNAALLILLVDERPEEVSEAISWGVGEVIASSFDQPALRHVEVTDIVLERARRLVETGKDVVIVLDSLTRMARAHNTAERGTGRTLSGGLDAQAMAKPKAFFGSARAIPSTSGGGSLTIIATALVETGSRMDDVIFEEFKGTGNSEIKLDRSLAEKRIYPAIDIATSGTRREEKLFRPDQLDAVFTLRRGLSQMPPQAGMEWLIKRIAGTLNNDSLLTGL